MSIDIITLLKKLKLTGMAQGLERQRTQLATYQELPFEERLGCLLQTETDYRQQRKQQRLLSQAKLRYSRASLCDLQYHPQRGLQRALVAQLSQMQWVVQAHNLLITGPTGCGKTWLACALAQEVCLSGFSVRYFRVPRLMETLRITHGDGSYPKFMDQLAKTHLVILDDWGLQALLPEQRRDLMEIIEDRYQVGSTLIISQLPQKHWYEYLGEPTLADALLDRLFHHVHSIELQGESMRKSKTVQPVLDQVVLE